MNKISNLIRETGARIQRDSPDDMVKIRQAVAARNGLQSWPIALGSPDSAQYQFGVARFNNRWYLSADKAVQDTLRIGEDASARIKNAITKACKEQGIEINFSSSDSVVRIPDPLSLSQADDHKNVRPRMRA